MKKLMRLLAIIFCLLFFSGCSLSQKKSTSNEPVSIAGNIWKSEDGGNTWIVKNKAEKKLSVFNFDVINIALNPNDNKDILVGLKKGGIIRSSDGGEIWKMTNFIAERAYGIEFDPVDSRIIYASGIWKGRGKLWKSENGGKDWIEIYTTPANGPFISSSLLDRFVRNNLYVAVSNNQLLKTTDSGTTWRNLFQTDSPVIRMRQDCSNSNIVYMLTLNGRLYRSKNSGETWEDITSNINAVGNFFDLETDPSISGWFYITGKNGISRTRDFGDSFEKVVILDNPQSFPVTTMTINPQNSKEIIYAAAQTLYKSEDNGEHWTTYQFNSDKIINIIKYDSTNPKNLYLGLKSPK